ncbi:hypothetical protein F5X99DRAFT_410296 [Biscogniauxia marginata]|nr:hypothetical protein F5X99DRAFT_410296 [Biscogniauxia marginata]
MSWYRWARDQYIRLSSLGRYPAGGDYMEALWQTLISNLKFECHVRPDVKVAKAEAESPLPIITAVGPLPPLKLDPIVVAPWRCDAALRDDDDDDDNEHGNQPSKGYGDAILKASNLYRRLCTMSDGLIGMAPAEAAVGDTGVCFSGAGVLFILRDSNTRH